VINLQQIIICEYLQTKEEREISVNEGALFAGGADVMGQVSMAEKTPYLFS